MTLSTLKTLNIKNGGHFFDKSTLRFFGETMRSYSIRQSPESKELVIVTRKSDGAEFKFSKLTGRWLTLKI